MGNNAAPHIMEEEGFQPAPLVPAGEKMPSCLDETPRDSVDLRVPPSLQIARGWLPSWAYVLLLVLLTLGVYQRSFRNGFVNYDDPDYVTKNLQVQNGLTGKTVFWAFTTTSQANWHPLTWLSHMLDVELFGMRPAGHHADNVLLHSLNVILIFLLFLSATGSAPNSFLVAALFALHPLNVESVAWVAERKSLLSTFFLLLALAGYGAYVRKPALWRYSLIVLCFALSLMAKPMAITFPFCLLLVDYWPLHRFSLSRSDGGVAGTLSTFWTLALEKTPLLLLSIGSAVITVYAQRAGGALGTLAALPFGQRVGNAIYSYVRYLAKGIWPTHLAVFYPHPEGSLALWKVAGAAALIALTSALVWQFRERRYLLAGWLWYLGTLAPVIGIIQVGRQAIADRYVYIPFLGIFVSLVWLADESLLRKRWGQAVGMAGAAVLLCAYSILTYTQIGYWREGSTLFAHALQVTPDNATSEYGLGAALVDAGQFDQAIPHFLAATRLAPLYSPAHYSLGTLLLRQNHLDEAETQYAAVIANTSDAMEAARAHNNLGVIFLRRNQPTAAFGEFSAAIRLNANEQNSLIGRGSLEVEAGNADAAITDCSLAAQIAPSALANLWLGRAFELKGDATSAAHAYESALRINPAYAEAQTRLSALRAKLPN